MTQELKNCPFCGGEAKHQEHYWYEGNSAGDYVFCTKCSARNARKRLVTDPTPLEAWNTRAGFATIPDPEAYIAAARGMREALEALWKAADSMGHTHNSSTADAQIMAACDAIATFDAAQREQ